MRDGCRLELAKSDEIFGVILPELREGSAKGV
jgi:hypothetical protein